MTMKTKGRKDRGVKRTVLVYDDDCPVCRSAADWIRKNQVKGSFDLFPCQSEEARKRFPFIEKAECMKAMQLILPNGKILAGERAIPEILVRLKRYSPMASLFRLPGSARVSRALYRWFADNRYHIAEVFFPKKRTRRRKD